MHKCVCMCVCTQSHSIVWLFATPWAITHQAPLSMEFSRQEYWSRLPFLPPGDHPKPGIKLKSLASPELTGGFFTTSTTWEALWCINKYILKEGTFICLFLYSHGVHTHTLVADTISCFSISYPILAENLNLFAAIIGRTPRDECSDHNILFLPASYWFFKAHW